jgi:hypothetical protein
MLVSVHAGHFRTITVDGDISDWNGISPALVEGDPEIGPYLKAFYLANDNEYLYLRFDMNFYPPNYEGNIALYIDVDLNWTNGASGLPYLWGDAMLIDTNPHLDSLHWKYESISPYTGELFYANYTFPNGVQRANVTYWQSNVEVFEYAIPLESLDVRNPYNQIRLAMPNELNHGPHQPSLWIVYDLELQSVIVSMNVARYKGTPITYTDSFVVDSSSNYTLIIENANLTSIEVKINGEKILQLADGNIDYEGLISSEHLIIGSNEISITPTGQPETFGIVKIKKN